MLGFRIFLYAVVCSFFHQLYVYEMKDDDDESDVLPITSISTADSLQSISVGSCRRYSETSSNFSNSDSPYIIGVSKSFNS